METELIEKVKKHLVPLEKEYIKAKTKFNKGHLNEKSLDRAADVEGWVTDLNIILDDLVKEKKLTFAQTERLNYLMEKT